jgi:two-component system OmpR family sensor kinase
MEERLGPNSIPMYLRMILALTLLGLLSNKIASYYYSPLNLIKSAIKDLSEGVLTTRLTNKLDDCSDDLRELSKRFDKMAEHLETLFLTKGEMLQHVVHELRTPLARANMAITLLQAEIPPKGQADLNLIKMQISELSSLVDEILSLEILYHAEFELNFSDFSLNEFIQTIVDNANYEINQKRARVESGRDLIIYADKELLARAVENIIRNSLLHSGDDTVISVYSVLKKNTLTISVNDNGKGIEDNKLKSIFEPFVQSEKKSANKQGYGLGLAIAKKVVVLHQGELKSTNIKPNGLSITLSIPQ